MVNGRDAVPPDSSPSPTARAMAFSAIIVAGACGGLIGFAFTDLGCEDGCTTAAGLAGLGTAVVTASGVAVVAVLVLRASAEWRASQPPLGSPGSPPVLPPVLSSGSPPLGSPGSPPVLSSGGPADRNLAGPPAGPDGGDGTEERPT